MLYIEISKIMSDIIISLAAITTATIAWKGLRSWKNELRGRADFELAQKLLMATFQLRDSIESCRSPWISAGELPDNYNRHPRNKDPEQEGQAMAYIYGNRWEKVSKPIQEFKAARIEAEVLWGSNTSKKIDALLDCVLELRAAIDMFIHNEFSDGEDFKSDKEYARKIKSKINTSQKEDNELTNKIQEAVKEIEAFVKPHLARS